MKIIFCLVACALANLASQAQELNYQRFLPHPLDSLSQYPLDSLVVYLNDMSNGGEPDQAGLKVASFHWNQNGQLWGATALQIREGQLRGKDSVSWIHRGDSTIRRMYVIRPKERDYWQYADPIHYGELDQMYWPPMEVDPLSDADTSIFQEGRVAKQLDGFSEVLYRYDAAGRLVEKETKVPERIAMGLGGYHWERFTYDHQGNLLYRTDINSGPNDRNDTLVEVFQYNSEGQLVTQLVPSASVPGVSSMIQYHYEDGQLAREEFRRTSFRSSGPPDYTRKQISTHFETTYRYQDGHLIEERLYRDEELESNGWIQYRYDKHGLMVSKTLMNVFDKVPYQVFTYQYFFHP